MNKVVFISRFCFAILGYTENDGKWQLIWLFSNNHIKSKFAFTEQHDEVENCASMCCELHSLLCVHLLVPIIKNQLGKLQQQIFSWMCNKSLLHQGYFLRRGHKIRLHIYIINNLKWVLCMKKYSLGKSAPVFVHAPAQLPVCHKLPLRNWVVRCSLKSNLLIW